LQPILEEADKTKNKIGSLSNLPLMRDLHEDAARQGIFVICYEKCAR
jgi:hypothetical protein